MTRPDPTPTATAHPADTAPTAGGATPAPGLWAQTHALRALADFLDRHGCDGLNLAAYGDRLDVQVPAALGDTDTRLAAVARLAAALDTPTTRRRAHAAPGAWATADGHLAGHPIHAYTRLDHEEPTP